MGYYPCLHVFPSRNVFLKHPKKHHKIASFQHLLSSLQIIISRHPKSSQIIISITSKHQKHQFYQNTQKASKRQFGSVQSVQIIKSINSIPSNHQITSNHPKSSNQWCQIITSHQNTQKASKRQFRSNQWCQIITSITSLQIIKWHQSDHQKGIKKALQNITSKPPKWHLFSKRMKKRQNIKKGHFKAFSPSKKTCKKRQHGVLPMSACIPL